MSSLNFPPVRTLMGPGPSDVSPRVLAALARPTLGHLDPFFISLMDDIKRLLQYALQTRHELTFAISGPGSAGMESCFVNLMEPGDKVIVCQNGVFGGRMYENVLRGGGQPVLIEDPWGSAVDPQKLSDALKKHPDTKIVAFVHAETSTGAQSNVPLLTEIAHANQCLVIVDAVTSLGGIPLKIDEWQVDAVYSGSQKCLSCVPGLSPLSFGPRAVEKIRRRKSKVQSWFLDVNLVMAYWGAEQKRSYHHTAPVNSLYALHEALLMLKEEGLENAWARHELHHRALRAGLEAMGLQYWVDSAVSLPQLNTICVPAGVDEAAVRRVFLNDFNIEIGAGLGSLAAKVWRIGLMGYTCQKKNVFLCLAAFEAVLSQYVGSIKTGQAIGAAEQVYLRACSESR